MSVAALLAVFIVAPFPETYSAFQNDVAVRGTVVNWYNHQPLSEALVRAYSPAGGLIETRTDRYGHFFLLTLLPGIYAFDAVKPGYHDICTPFGTHLQRSAELHAGLQYNVRLMLGPAITQNGHLVTCIRQ